MLDRPYAHTLPLLESRAPTVAGPLFGAADTWFEDDLVRASGVNTPTVLVVNLEGRFPGAAVLHDWLLSLGRSLRGGLLGPLAIVLATPDAALGETVRAICTAYDLPFFLASSRDSLDHAEPLGPLSRADQQTMEVLRRLGGRATASMVAQTAGIDHTAAGNRLANLDRRHILLRVDQPRRQGHLYLDPRSALAAEEPTDPTDTEFGLTASMKSDVRALAEMQGREPESVLAEAFQDFLAKHRDRLEADYRDVGRMVQESDESGLASYVGRHGVSRARSRTRKSK
jgi:hypothetical protein